MLNKFQNIDRLYKSAIMLCVDFILLCLAVYFSFALRLGEIWPSQDSDFLFYVSRSAWIFLVLLGFFGFFGFLAFFALCGPRLQI